MDEMPSPEVNMEIRRNMISVQSEIGLGRMVMYRRTEIRKQHIATTKEDMRRE